MIFRHKCIVLKKIYIEEEKTMQKKKIYNHRVLKKKLYTSTYIIIVSLYRVVNEEK